MNGKREDYKQAAKLIELASQHIYPDGSFCCPERVAELKTQALALLKPKCATCGGSRMVKCKCCGTYVCRNDGKPNPCPDCPTEQPSGELVAMPVRWIGKIYNACTDPCDMLYGPCACGAFHSMDEWVIKRKKLTSGGWVDGDADRIEQLEEEKGKV